MFRLVYALAALILLCLAVPALAAELDAPREVADLLQDRKYDEAIAAIDKLLSAKDTKAPDYLRYLKGRAQHLNKDFDAAIATFDEVSKNDEQSANARRARFAKAVSLARKGDYRAAEAIYKVEADRLLSLDRKQEIANIYLEFAETYFAPTKLDQKPDYAKALEFYKRALEVGPQTDKKVELELRIAECHQRLAQHDQAIALLKTFLKDHPTHKLAIEARYRLGESQLASDQWAEARRTWQDLLQLHADSQSPRLPEAAFRLASTYRLPAPNDNEDLSLGVAALEAFLEKYPEHKLAGQANLLIVQSYIHRGRFEDAVTSAKKFLADERYSKREEIPAARSLLGIAYKIQQKYDEALAVYTEFLAKHPTHQAWAQVQQEIINVEYLKAEVAFNAKKYDEARKLWEAFLAKYPLNSRNPLILYRFGQMKFREEKYDEAIAAWRQLVSKYPGGNESSLAQLMIGVTLEDKQGSYEEALKEYKKLNWGDQAASASQRVARLTAKAMTVATERVFRSGETPTIKLTTRNIDTVTVRVYSVDLETYFRKMHLASGIENLDISLIDPDSTFEFKVPDYHEHKQFESQVEVPLPTKGDVKGDHAGVMAVTISSKTLEATTLILKSDLDVVVKSSRDELLVFAQNLKTGKPWPGARVLIADGSKVFAEEKTGEDGVFHKSFKELAASEDVRVFAISDRHTASNMVGLSGVGAATGLSDKGYIFTDRPAYRAGQLVNVRGVIRRVDGDRFTVQQGKKYRCDVYDNRNRLLYEAEVQLSAFGSFFTNFSLPVAVPQGQYRIVVHDNDKQSYEGSFVVHEYQLEPVRLEVTSERTVFYRGEEITGKIKASYYYGAPLAGKEIRYRLADGRTETATTDASGEVAFELETRDFRESQPLTLTVELPERSLATGKTFFLATQGYTLDVKTVRPLYLAGETFEVTVSAKDAEQKPLSEALTLQVLQQTNTDGKTGEVAIEKHELKTDAKSGEARKTLRLDKGATYILRVSGVDRFQNTITHDATVTISDDEDATRLRILADQHSYKVGDTGSVVLHWRDKPALALVTFEGARILDYKLVQLQEGANKFEIPFVAQLAPNFDLAVSVMTDTRPDPKAKPNEEGKLPAIVRFHETASSFSVARDLRVKMTYKRAGDKEGELRPGDELEVTFETTDPQGKPLSAEVSLALIEQSLLERFPWAVPAIQDFFRDTPRASAMRTASSITFAYHPTTKPINPQLLAEKDRLEVEKEEVARREALALHGGDERGGIVVAESAAPILAATGEALAEDTPALGADFDHLYRLPVGGSGPAGGGVGLGGIWFGRPARSSGGVEAQLGQQQAGVQLDLPNADGIQQQLAEFTPANDAYSLGMNASGKQNHWRYLNFADNGNAQARGDVRRLYDQQWGDVQLLQRDGTVTNFNLQTYFGSTYTEAKAERFIADMKQLGAVMMPPLALHETGYWNPAIVTDAKGQATIRITLPDRSTAWTLLARGVTAETLAGEAEAKFAVKKPLFGQLKLPLAFTDGDTAQITASIHNDLLDKGEITAALKTTLGGKTTTLTKQVKVDNKGIVDVNFEQQLQLPADAPQMGAPTTQAEFELTITAGEKTDVVKRVAAVQPYGVPVYSVRGGTAQGDVTITVEQPKGMTLVAPRLEVLLGPTVEQSLVDALLAPATWCQFVSLRLAAGTDTASSDLLAALALQQLMGKSRDAENPQAAEMDARVRSSISLLVASQNDDGGWSWSGQHGTSSSYSSARVLWALSLAKKAGYRVGEEHTKAITYLQAQVTASGATDYESRAVLLQALTAAGKEDVTLANQLYRNRQSLSAAGIVHLALAFVDMDRKQTAAELLTLLEKRNLDEPEPTPGKLSWNQSPAELRALYALALEAVSPADVKLAAQVDWLMAHRVGHRWSPDKATGPALLAISKWFARTRFQSEKYKLTIYVNDLLAKEVEVTPETRTQTIEISPKLLKGDKKEQTVRFELNGRGRYTYQAVLGGFVPSDKLANTTPAWRVERTYEPAPLELFGESIPRGFDVVAGPVTQFRNELNQLPVGKRGRVELKLTRPGLAQTTADYEVEYLVITEPIPAGTAVIESSITGNFERFEVGAGAITFYVGSRRSIGTIGYDLHGYLPGDYRTTPTIVRNAYRLDQMAVAKTKDMKVLPLGEKAPDKYRLTPRELYELGKRQFDKGQLAQAAPHLNELYTQWNLGGEFYKDTVRMLLDVNLAQNKPAEVVKFFEIIIEKFPDVELPFAKFIQAGEAYHKVGEYERSYLVFRAVIEASFLRESRVAGFLQEQGEFLRSVEVMTKLLAEYPSEPYIAAATYALAQNIYAKAPQAASDAKLREKHVTRIDLIQQARTRLDNFLTEHPDDPAADEASFSLANALLDMELYDKAIERATRFAARYADSPFLDSYWYIIGFCHYAQGEHKQALEMCEKVADATRLDKATGRMVESPNKWRAIYILGQIYHSLGQPGKAIEYYTRVNERFEDAREAIEFFTQKTLKLPEVTTLKPGEATPLELKYRNVATVDITVYRIDLMKFSLLRRSLEEITQINLAGIRPIHEQKMQLGEGKDFREKTASLKLPLKDEGAYLVVCRGENLHSSGMVVISPLVLEVQEEVSAGRVRTTVRDVVKDAYVPNVHVKTIGSRNSEFISGDTDLRGIFVADGVQGTAMVIAEATAGRYAFYRGTRDLGPPPPAANAPAEPAPQQAEGKPQNKGGKEALLDDLRASNATLQVEQQKQLQEVYDNGIKGGFNSGGVGGGVFNKGVEP